MFASLSSRDNGRDIAYLSDTKPIPPILKKNEIKIVSPLLKTGSVFYSGKICIFHM